MKDQDVREELTKVKRTLATLICWMGGSANTPINDLEVRDLLKMLGDTKLTLERYTPHSRTGKRQWR